MAADRRAKLDTTKWAPGWWPNSAGSSNPVNGGGNAAYSAGNISVDADGYIHLALTTKPITGPSGKTYANTGSLISSRPDSSNGVNGFEAAYGVAEARILLPPDSTGKIANWPAFWWTSPPGETYNEIDILEGLSGSAAWHFHCDAATVGENINTSPGWHTYTAEWAPGIVTFFYDAIQVGTASSGVLGNPLYLILNHTVASAQTAVAADMLVDYVRAWTTA